MSSEEMDPELDTLISSPDLDLAGEQSNEDMEHERRSNTSMLARPYMALAGVLLLLGLFLFTKENHTKRTLGCTADSSDSLLVEQLPTVQVEVEEVKTTAAPPVKVYKDAAEFVLIIADPRTSSTEQAEGIGNHPCAYSMNE